MYSQRGHRAAPATACAYIILAAFTAFLALHSTPARAEIELERLQLSVGYFDFNKSDNESVAIDAMLLGGELWWKLRPQIGVMVNTDGGVYGHAGFHFPINVSDHWVLTPMLSVGGYGEGDSKALGHVLEFRSSLEFGYRFDNGMQLSAFIYHLSNASIGDENPGTEVAGMTYSLPW